MYVIYTVIALEIIDNILISSVQTSNTSSYFLNIIKCPRCLLPADLLILVTLFNTYP